MPRLEWSFFMPAEDHYRFKWCLTWLKYRFTSWGLIILLIIVIGLAISSVGTQISAYLLPSYIFAFLLTAYFFSFFFSPKVRVQRILPGPLSAGGYCTYKVTVKNIGKYIIRNLTVFEQCLPYGLYAYTQHEEFNNIIDWLEPGEQTTFTLALRIPRRGTFEFPFLVAGSSFPSGLIRSTRRVGNREKFIVYPKLSRPLELHIDFRRQFQPGGISLSSKVGDSNEFSSTREYRQGDRLRDVHWVSSAKTGKLIVKEYIEEYFVRVGLFLDTELSRFEKHKCFESRICLCAGIADMLNKNDNIVDLFLSDEHHQHVQIGRGVRPFHHLLEILSVMEGDSSVNFQESVARIQEHAPQLSILICFLKDWDLQRSRFIGQLKDLGIKVRTMIVRDAPTTLAIKEENVTVHELKGRPGG